MKIIRFLIAGAVALWTVGIAVGVVRKIGQHGGVRGTTDIFAGIGVFTAFLLFTIWSFQWALRPLKRCAEGDKEDNKQEANPGEARSGEEQSVQNTRKE